MVDDRLQATATLETVLANARSAVDVSRIIHQVSKLADEIRMGTIHALVGQDFRVSRNRFHER